MPKTLAKILCSPLLTLCFGCLPRFACGLFAAKQEVLSLCIDDLPASRINNIVQYYIEKEEWGGEAEAAAKKKAHKLNV